MFVSVERFPLEHVQNIAGSGGNGSFSQEVRETDSRLVLNFSSRNRSGQRILLNEAWLRSLGLTEPRFAQQDNTPLDGHSSGGMIEIRPNHFSFIYAFQRDEFFRKERDSPGSEIHWDPANQRISVVNDRTTDNELFSRQLPRELDPDTSFTLTSRWRATAQGNWQTLLPLFITSNNNPAATNANSIYFLYASRDSINPMPPQYYLRYADATNTLRVDVVYTGLVDTEYRFYVDFNAVTRVLRLEIRSSSDSTLAFGSYTLGTNPSDGFGFGKVGVSSRFSAPAPPVEPVTVGWVDDVVITYGIIANPSVELDANLDGVPDNWHPVWYFASRTNSDSHSGRYSIQVADTRDYDGGGMETDHIPATAGIHYEATVYAKVLSGSFYLNLDFFNADGAVVGSAQVSISTTNGVWRRLLVDRTAESGTATMRGMVWSTTTNIGTAYFDDLFVGKGKLANSGVDIDQNLDGIPDSWILSGGATRGNSPHSGAFSIHLQSVGSVAEQADVPAAPGVLYVGSAYANVTSGTQFLELSFRDASHNQIRSQTIELGMTHSYYVRVKVSQVAPASTLYVHLRLGVLVSGGAEVDDISVQLAPMGLNYENTLWAMDMPTGNWGGLGQTDVNKMLTWSLDLGVGHLRTGSAWNDWRDSQNGPWNYDLLMQHRRFVNAATAVGLGIDEGVGGGRTWWCAEGDAWPKTLYSRDKASFFNELQALGDFVGRNLGSDIHYYQMWNEANHPCDAIAREDDPRLFISLSAGLTTGEGVYSEGPRSRWFETSINYYADWSGWADDLVAVLATPGTGVDIAAIDHYPSTWTNEGVNPIGSDWSPLDSLISIINNSAGMGDGRPLKGGIIETGFTTCENIGWVHNEIRQQTWINNALPIIKSKAATQYSSNYNKRLVVLGWYTIKDSGGPLPTCTLDNPLDILVAERNFGIVRMNDVPKIGYPDLKARIGEFPYL